jgi:hypothetical protein
LEELEGRLVFDVGTGSGLWPTDFGSIEPIVNQTGHLSLSVDGLGIVNATNTSISGTIQVEKPAGASVRNAYLATAAAGFSGAKLKNTDVKIDGTFVAWDIVTVSSIRSFNHWADVTSLVKPKIDAAPAVRVDLTIWESKSILVEGHVLAVVFDDPGQTTNNTVALLFGAQNVAGDTFNIRLAEPVNKSDPNLVLDMSLGISFSGQPAQKIQYTLVNVNGSRLTTSAGGSDDGVNTNGAIITVGGLDDSDANPADPLALPGAPYDDELYNLVPFVEDGATTISVFTQNPSLDDNLFFAAFNFKATTALAGAGILLGPVESTHDLGTPGTFTATVQDGAGQPVAGQPVAFDVLSGPQAGLTGTATTGADGTAAFTYTGLVEGNDLIQASFVNGEGKMVLSNEIVSHWARPNQPPTVSAGGPYTVAEGGSVTLTATGEDPDGDLIYFAWDLDDDGLFETPGESVTFSAAALDGPSTHAVRVEGYDGHGHLVESAGAVTVINVAPAVSAGDDATIDEGGTFGGTGTFTDPGPDTWTATVDYGDGSGEQTLALGADKTFALSHLYADNGTYTVTVKVRDDDGGEGIDNLTVTVNNVAPAPGITSWPDNGVRGQPLFFEGRFTDPGSDTWTATVDYGDGTAAQPLPLHADKTFAFSHVYADNGTYPLTVTVADDDGGTGGTTQQVPIQVLAYQADPGDPDKTALVVGGTPGNDTIHVNPVGNTGAVEVFLDSVSLGTFRPTGRIIIYAQAGNDTIQVAGAVTLPAELYGGDGEDRIFGGGGDNLILGGGGDDFLIGGAGRNVILGGVGADRILDNGDEDILIAGTTLWDNNPEALRAITREWWRRDCRYDQRVASIRSGVLGPSGKKFRLDGTTVLGDTDPDKLTGGGGLDWIFSDALDDVTGH